MNVGALTFFTLYTLETRRTNALPSCSEACTSICTLAQVKAVVAIKSRRAG